MMLAVSSTGEDAIFILSIYTDNEGRVHGQKETWTDGWEDRHNGSMEAQRCQGPKV